MESWQELVSQLEGFAVSGRHEECRQILSDHNPKKIPRNLASHFGDLAVRVNLPIFALKVLQRIVYPENSLAMDRASSREKIIYSMALIGLGALSEAIEMLDGIDYDLEPEALLHRAGASLYDWNSSEAVSYLRRYVNNSSQKLTPYKRLVGKVNLAAVMIGMSDWISAHTILDEVVKECEVNSHLLLLGNCFELKAQVEIFQGHSERAVFHLEKASEYLKNQGGIFLLFVKKWSIVCESLKNRKACTQFNSLRLEATELGHWNTLRECDLFQAIATKDEDLFKKVVMGTPSEFYRHRARKLFGANYHSLGQYQWHLAPAQSTNLITTSQKFDAYERGPNGQALHEKPLLLKLFDAMTEDFYQPNHLGRLFQKIYPNEKFNPFSSPNRVLQLLRRLDSWFVENQCPLRIDFKKSEFKLTAIESVLVSVQRGIKRSPVEAKIIELKKNFQDRCFTVAEAAKALAVSEVSVRRLLAKAGAAGKLEKEQKSQGLSYRVSIRKTKKKVA